MQTEDVKYNPNTPKDVMRRGSDSRNNSNQKSDGKEHQKELPPGYVEKKLLSNGAEYTGHMLNGQRDGYGVMIWPDGSRYEGCWKNDVADGLGRLINKEGDVYEGIWKEDKPSGFGIYRHYNGAVYIGEWNDDKQEGRGIEFWPD